MDPNRPRTKQNKTPACIKSTRWKSREDIQNFKNDLLCALDWSRERGLEKSPRVDMAPIQSWTSPEAVKKKHHLVRLDWRSTSSGIKPTYCGWVRSGTRTQAYGVQARFALISNTTQEKKSKKKEPYVWYPVLSANGVKRPINRMSLKVDVHPWNIFGHEEGDVVDSWTASDEIKFRRCTLQSCSGQKEDQTPDERRTARQGRGEEG